MWGGASSQGRLSLRKSPAGASGGRGGGETPEDTFGERGRTRCRQSSRRATIHQQLIADTTQRHQGGPSSVPADRRRVDMNYAPLTYEELKEQMEDLREELQDLKNELREKGY